ncbi:hypothetical protein AMTRI_Chr02g220640 [Amborella trichopoda]
MFGPVVSKLHEIANRMVSSGYQNEKFFKENILRLGFQKLGVKDVKKMGTKMG